MIIFDLDETLINWHNHDVFPDVRFILQSLRDAGYILAIASYNEKTKRCLIDFDLLVYFDYIQYEKWSSSWFQEQLKAEKNGLLDISLSWQRNVAIDNKRTMLENILKYSGIAAKNTLFFDDQKRFIDTAESLGIHGELVGKDGVTIDLINKSLTKFKNHIYKAN
jgi:HAD superfamily phosphatase (TIGR01681 family)